MRRPIIAGNWKMNTLLPEAAELASGVIERMGKNPGVEVVLAPPFTALCKVRDLIEGTGILLAGQNICSEPGGAYTGEISAAMLEDAGCHYVILGHSERRRVFHEDDLLVNQKIKTALKFGLKVIFCVGETLEERENKVTRQVVRGQLEKGLEGLSDRDLQNMVIAYEPVWAIGTGRTATADQAQEIHGYSREIIERLFGQKTADALRIQYGGSVTPENSRELLAQKDIDGALVGSASLKPESFCAIIKSVN